MKVAKNMDSVFANSTQDELDFDVLFPDDDTIIDFVAGVDESGIPLTGPDFDYTSILKEADMLEDADDEDEREGKVAHNGTPEGSKDVDLKVGGEVGDGKEVSGKEKSAESEAHDMEKLGSETAQQVAIQKAMEIGAKKFADKECCKENFEYEGYEELIEAVVNGFMSDEEIMSENASQIAMNTADYLIESLNEGCSCGNPDCDGRCGKTDPDNKGNMEGVKSEVIDRETKGCASKPFEDQDDSDLRDGKAKRDNSNIEGIATRIIGAAMESTVDGDLDKVMDNVDDDSDIETMNKDIVPDSVQDNTDANKIDLDIKNTQESAYVDEKYKALIGGMKDGLQKLALADAMNESVIEIAAAVYEASAENDVPFNECEGYSTVVEAVIAAMPEDLINSENATSFALEAADYICSESGKSNVPTNKNSAAKKGIASSVGNFVKGHKKAVAGAAIGAGALTAAGIAAKKIHDKKKAAAQNQEEVKENYEYEEYKDLVEAVIAGFTEEEIMAENASEMACAVADILIEKAEDMGDLVTNDDDDDDIESIAANDDPKISLAYDYDDDELIDMVVNDTEL